MQEVVGSSPIISNNFKMKKILLAFFILPFLALNFAFAANLLPYKNQKPKHYLQFNLSRSFSRGIEHDQTFFSAEYNFDFTPFLGFAAIQIEENILNATFRTQWIPLMFQTDRGEWRLGGAASYRLQKYSCYYDEHDFIFESAARWNSKNNFSIAGRLGYSWRLTFFPDIPDFHFCEGDIVFKNEFCKAWNFGLEIFGALGSYSDFRHPLFFCPQMQAGVAYNFDEHLRLAAQVEWGTTDFLASVIYVSYTLVKFNVRFSF